MKWRPGSFLLFMIRKEASGKTNELLWALSLGGDTVLRRKMRLEIQRELFEALTEANLSKLLSSGVGRTENYCEP